MRRKPNFLRKFLSLNQWRKRANSGKLFAQMTADADFEKMKRTLIEEGEAAQTRGHSKDLLAHVDSLRREFAGQPELVWHHAKLIVLMRRGYKLDETFAEFRRLWVEEEEWLCEHLNIRWLVSACDTFAEHSKDGKEQAMAFAVSLMVNTMKVYETENYLTGAAQIPYDEAKIAHLQTDLVPIFEGLSCFTVGTDDTLRNMVWRMKDVAADTFTGRILLEVFSRLQVEESAFKRLRMRHHRKNTAWWDD